LHLQMSEEQKRLAEAILQDALMVQARLQEPEASPDHLDKSVAETDQGVSTAE
jgi:hypothetical protein